MIPRALFGLIALVPAALNAAPVHGTNLTLPLCDGGVAHGAVTVPLGHAPLPGADQAGCCAKGCHGSRKRNGQSPIDPPQ